MFLNAFRRSFLSTTKAGIGLHNTYSKNFAYLIDNIPTYKVFVRKEYLTNFQSGQGVYEEGVWITCKAKLQKALLFETMLIQYGALYDKLPISAFVWRTDVKPEELLPLDCLQLWNCLSYNITVIEKTWLQGLHVDVLMKNSKMYTGTYLFTIDFCSSDPNVLNSTDSERPEEHKSSNIIKLDNGQFCAQPNNRIWWRQPSLIPDNRLKPYFKACTIDYTAEVRSRWSVGDCDDYFYTTKQEKDDLEKKRD